MVVYDTLQDFVRLFSESRQVREGVSINDVVRRDERIQK